MDGEDWPVPEFPEAATSGDDEMDLSNQAFEFHVKESERRSCYLGIVAHMQNAMDASWHHDEDEELEELVMAHDLLSEVMGR